MAFVLPTFPLVCKVVTFVGNPVGQPARLTTPCQLRAPNVSYASSWVTVQSFAPGIMVLFPKGTDIRDKWCSPVNSPDYLEIPENSGRWYFATYVDDIAKGFANEHRFAHVGKVQNPLWPTPIT